MQEREENATYIELNQEGAVMYVYRVEGAERVGAGGGGQQSISARVV